MREKKPFREYVKMYFMIYLPCVLMLLFYAVALIGFMVFPNNEVIVRLPNMTSMNKMAAMLVPIALSTVGGALMATNKKTRPAGMVVMVFAAIIDVMLFTWNL